MQKAVVTMNFPDSQPPTLQFPSPEEDAVISSVQGASRHSFPCMVLHSDC